MADENQQDPQRALRERIVTLMRANEQARKKATTDEERQKLKTAASRLEQILKTAADSERQVLASAAKRLDRLLQDIRNGKDVTDTIGQRDGKNRNAR